MPFAKHGSREQEGRMGQQEGPARKKPRADVEEVGSAHAAFASVGNKEVRTRLKGLEKAEKKKAKKERQNERKRVREELGDAAPPKMVAKTLDSMREHDETVVDVEDEEIEREEEVDEYSDYFAGKVKPKVLVTTGIKRSKVTFDFLKDFCSMIPGVHYYKRGTYEMKKICEYAAKREFTDVLVTQEDHKKMRGMWLVHLPNGPTAHFKLTSVRLSKNIRLSGNPTSHRPELILNNFNTRLGKRMGRMVAALFPLDPQFRGRRVITCHNQRDFLFFRQHRYMFEETREARKEVDGPMRAKLQEIGPRFTLKLKSLQLGAFDTKEGEYEWYHKTDMDTSRKRFFL